MRRLLAGILLLSLLCPIAALAETKGEVEAIGFGSLYRPNCHIPMLVRVQADKSGTYQIRVIQDDLDADQPLFTQTVSLTGSDDGSPGSEQRFWLYFIPQPTDGGLPDVTDGLRAIQQTLKVFLCDENGRQIIQLPVTSTIQNIEKAQAGPLSTVRGVKLILSVADGAAQPVWRDYQQAIGTIEDVVFVPLRVADLPEDARGYEAVDGIVWLNAPPPDPAKAADEKRYHALREYVRGGGHMVICQPAQRDANETFADLLPVEVKEVAPRDSLQPLRRLATAKRPLRRFDENEEARGPLIDDWDLPRPPFMFARGVLKKGAVAPEMMTWKPDGSDASPYLARIGYGAGCVTWVAHDLSDPSITARAKSGWPFVWDRVLDLEHDTIVLDNLTPDDVKQPYQASSTMDVGTALLKGMELKSKSAMLVTIAVVFFIAYWIVAGPGIYLYLVTKSRPQLSWFMFAFSAVAATVLTVLIVKLVVRGPPELSHVTLVRTSPDAPGLSISRFGLYIPRDGAQELVLPEIEPRAVSYVTAYPAHPAHLAGADIEFPAHMQYIIPTRDPATAAEEPVKISVPYRSTLKRFQARRVGPAGAGIEGKPRLRETEGGIFALEGTLVNATGQRLRNVYFAFHQPPASESRGGRDAGADYIYFLPAWEKSQSVDLAATFNKAKFVGTDRSNTMSGRPEDGFPLRDRLGRAGQEEGWTQYWYAGMKSTGFGNQTLDPDLDARVGKAFPMMSLFGRLPPMRNSRRGGQPDRVELLRRGGRNLDCSAAVAAGRLVVLAEADGPQPLPFPLEVEGDKVEGSGKLFYQSVLDLERIDLPPSTQPAGDNGNAAAEAPAPPAPPAPQPPDGGAAAVPFDPAAHVGGKGNLNQAQWMQVLQYRRDQYRKAVEAKKQGRQPPSPAAPAQP